MNTMTYKGHTARVEYDERDNLFVGRILGIRNIISFHGDCPVCGRKGEASSAPGSRTTRCRTARTMTA
jgi:predicted HicB family RNase H-like nuclease